MIGLYTGKNTTQILEDINNYTQTLNTDTFTYKPFNFETLQSNNKFNKILISVPNNLTDTNNLTEFIKHNNHLLIENFNGILSMQNRYTFNDIIKNININDTIYCCPTFTLNNCTFTKSKLLIKPCDAQSQDIAHNVILINNLDVLLNNKHIFNYNFVIQPFLQHDEIIYKVYYLNTKIFVTHRYSLDGHINNDSGIEYFGRISDKKNNNRIQQDRIMEPSHDDLVNLGTSIRKLFGVFFFGIDIIRDTNSGKYYIIDINHLPSFHGIENKHIVLHDEITKLLIY